MRLSRLSIKSSSMRLIVPLCVHSARAPAPPAAASTENHMKAISILIFVVAMLLLGSFVSYAGESHTSFAREWEVLQTMGWEHCYLWFQLLLFAIYIPTVFSIGAGIGLVYAWLTY